MLTTVAWPAGATAMSANGRAVVVNSRFANAEENDMRMVPSRNGGAQKERKTRPLQPAKLNHFNTQLAGCP
jgi:hypothetical protein